MANKCTIELPVSLGDTIYLKEAKIVNCRYWGDKYAGKNGLPNCDAHEYDCCAGEPGGQPCNAEYEYSVSAIKVIDIILTEFAMAIIKNNDPYWSERTDEYLLTKEEADRWVEEMTRKEAERRAKAKKEGEEKR